MPSFDWIGRAPLLLTIISGIILCIMMMPRYKLPAALALTALIFNLLQNIFATDLATGVRSLVEDREIGQRLVNMVLSSGSAIQWTIMVLAVFLGRHSQLKRIEAPREHVHYAISQIAAGQSHAQIEAGLAQRGLAQPIIDVVLNEVGATAAAEIHKAGLRNIVIGALLCTVGLVVSVGTYLIAANAPGGGKFMVTYGIVVFGAAQLIRGLVQVTK